MPANLAREAVDKTPKMVLLRARKFERFITCARPGSQLTNYYDNVESRKTFKAIMTMPVLAPPPLAETDTSMGDTLAADVLNKRAADDTTKDAVVKRSRVAM